MLAYYANLIGLAFRDIPGSLGSNWLGLIFPTIIVFVGECIACAVYGWRTMIVKWKQATLVGFASLGLSYLALFTWCIAVQNYTGYSSLSMANSSLNELVATAHERQRFAVLQAQTECAKTIGRNENLERQNKDQQSTINSCLNQALSFIKPPQLHIDSIKISVTGSGYLDEQYLLLTNKTIVPVHVTVTCTQEMKSAGVQTCSCRTYCHLGKANLPRSQ